MKLLVSYQDDNIKVFNGSYIVTYQKDITVIKTISEMLLENLYKTINETIESLYINTVRLPDEPVKFKIENGKLRSHCINHSFIEWDCGKHIYNSISKLINYYLIGGDFTRAKHTVKYEIKSGKLEFTVNDELTFKRDITNKDRRFKMIKLLDRVAEEISCSYYFLKIFKDTTLVECMENNTIITLTLKDGILKSSANNKEEIENDELGIYNTILDFVNYVYEIDK